MKKEFFIKNRNDLRQKSQTTSPIVLAGNSLVQKSADTAFPFTQDSSFWYLTGLEEPSLVMVIDENEEYIILPEPDPIREKFDGAVNVALLKKISGVKSIYQYAEGWRKLETTVTKSKQVATLTPALSYIPQLTMFTQPSRRSLCRRLRSINSAVEFIDLKPQLASMRMIKQPEEIQCIRKAVDYTHELYISLESVRKSAKNERDLMAQAMYEVTLKQLDFAYEPIIASGKNALTLHYIANNSPIHPKDFLLVDIGVRYGNYNADITRSVISKPTARQREVYEAVQDVQQYAIGLLKPGSGMGDYEEQVGKYMGAKLKSLGLIKTPTRKNIMKYYPHATSHSLGIDAHDPGNRNAPLAPGMIITVEPGIYIAKEGMGIRIEDDILITEDGNEILSKNIPQQIDRLA